MAKGREGGWASVYAVSIWQRMEQMGEMLTIGWYGKMWMYYTGSSSKSLKLFPNKKWKRKNWVGISPFSMWGIDESTQISLVLIYSNFVYFVPILLLS